MKRPFDHRLRRLRPALLLALLLGCGTPAGDGEPGGEVRVRHMLSYSLLEHLDGAVVESATRTAIERRVVAVGGVERPAIQAPAPAQIRFEDLRIYGGARLVFAAGISDDRPERRQDGVRFAVRVAAGEEPEVEVWGREVLPGAAGDRRWLDVDLDLAAFAGRTVDVVLVTEPADRRRGQRSAWGSPELRSAGSEIALSELPITRLLLVEDLRSPPRSRLRFEVPPRAQLEVAGEVRRRGGGRDPERVGAAEFRVRIDGEPVLRRPLRAAAARAEFAATVALDELAGDTVELELEIEIDAEADPAGLRAEWLRAAVLRSESEPRAPASSGRNLLLVVVDTLRADHMGVYGYRRDTTPNLDRLAPESAVFEQAVSQSSWTMPATASILTGLQPPEHGVTDGQALGLGFDTLAEALQASGLTTFAVSANPVVGREEGFDQGFERFVHLPWARAPHLNDVFRAFVEEHRDLRWFAYLHYVDPHDPYDAPGAAGRAFTGDYSGPYADVASFRKLFRAVNFGDGEARPDDRDLEYLEAAYDGEILYWDAFFGQLLDSLRRLGVLENTVVVVTSDHGEEFMEHGKLKHGQHLYEESVRVPLIVHAPGLVAAGRHPRPLETRGLYGAALALTSGLGLDAEGGLLAPGGRPVFSQTTHTFLIDERQRTELAAVRDGNWKLIYWPELGRAELYDLAGDPAERVDRASAEPERRDRYRQLVERWLARGRDDESPTPEATLDELRALGYVQ